MIKILDTKYKQTMRMNIIMMILFDWKEGMTEKELDDIYHLVIAEFDLDWLHPRW